MKKLKILVITIGIILFGYSAGTSQIIDPNKIIVNEGESRVNKNINEGVDKGFDGLEEGIGNLFRRRDKKDKTDEEAETDVVNEEIGSEEQDPESNTDNSGNTGESNPVLNWSKYDFVPGDKVIFEDNLIGEENGEFPSRWDLKQGNIEIAEFGGENVIMFRDGHPTIVPYFKDAPEDYLPDIFTIEFDLYCGTDKFKVFLYDRKNQKSISPSGYTYFQINYREMQFGSSVSRHPDEKMLEQRRWVHVSIAYTSGKLKAYMDDIRLVNIPRIDFDPSGLSLDIYSARNNYLFYVKNIRIAEGGVKYYDRVLQDGKIIASGIRFDVNKASLKPESMGVINEIFELMKKNPDLNFSVEGHTDSDGNEAFNLELSEKRAETVVNTLIKMGISPDRLSFKGLGESKPIEDNSSPEGKASNRRVEFVKI